MSYPHDYYDTPTYPHPGAPHLHNRGEARPYIEPDWYASHHDAQLPALSTIGRGPRGEGFYVDDVVNEDGVITFSLKSTITGEVAWQSPNLAPASITIESPEDVDVAAGVNSYMVVTVSRDGASKSTTVPVPCGERGSLILLSNHTQEFNGHDPDGNPYPTRDEPFQLYKTSITGTRQPRVGDLVALGYHDTAMGDYGLCLAIIYAVDTTSVTCMAKTFMSASAGDEGALLTPVQAQDMVDQIFS